MCVVLARFDGHEPSLFDEDLRQAQARFLVPDGVGSVGIDFPRCDGGLGPVINEPIQELFNWRRAPARLFNRLFDRRWSSLIQSFKQVHRFQSSSVLSVIAACDVVPSITLSS